MKHQLRYNYRIYPTETQKVFLAQSFGCARFVYNYGVGAYKEAYECNGSTISYQDLALDITCLKDRAETSYLKGVSSTLLQQSARDCEQAFNNFFFHHRGYPKFKNKKDQQSFRLTKAGFKIKDGVLTIAKVKDPIKVIWSKPLPAEPSSATIIKNRQGQYFVSFVIEIEVAELPSLDNSVGCDLGVREFLALSTGEKIPNPRFLEIHLVRLRKLQRKYARKREYQLKKVSGDHKKVKTTINMQKILTQISRLHKRIANMRNDFLHQLTTRLVRENQVISIEDLNVKGMVKNSKLARLIIQLGWGMFRRMLTYKCKLYGRYLVVIDRFFPSSKICNLCKHKFHGLKSQKYWICPVCGVLHDRDENASKNINEEGLRVLRNMPLGRAA
jgi:putative transposase